MKFLSSTPFTPFPPLGWQGISSDVTWAVHWEDQSDSVNKQEILSAYSSDIKSIKSAFKIENL